MSQIVEIKVPDIGNFKDVDVIEVMVKAGDKIEKEQGLITLETDKAAMDVPSPYAGTVKDVKVKPGAKVSQGSLILTLEVSETAEKAAEPTPAVPAPSSTQHMARDVQGSTSAARPLEVPGGGGGRKPGATNVGLIHMNGRVYDPLIG